jgi:hypothetical protein
LRIWCTLPAALPLEISGRTEWRRSLCRPASTSSLSLSFSHYLLSLSLGSRPAVCNREALWNRRGRGCSRVNLMETTYWYLNYFGFSPLNFASSSCHNNGTINFHN